MYRHLNIDVGIFAPIYTLSCVCIYIYIVLHMCISTPTSIFTPLCVVTSVHLYLHLAIHIYYLCVYIATFIWVSQLVSICLWQYIYIYVQFT